MTDTASREMLDGAIARNAGLVLSLPSAGMLRHHKSRFLAAATDGFWVESAAGEAVLIDSLITSQQPAGISFKIGPTKVVFASEIRRRDPEHRVNASTILEGLFVSFPSEIKSQQRRNDYRVRVPADAGLTVRIWRILPRVYLGDRPSAKQEIPTEFLDLSTGGMGVTFSSGTKEPVKLTTEDRLRIELTHGEEKLLLEGSMRHAYSSDGPNRIRAGVNFKALQANLEGRQILATITRIVGELQRNEVRQMRLGLCKAS